MRKFLLFLAILLNLGTNEVLGQYPSTMGDFDVLLVGDEVWIENYKGNSQVVQIPSQAKFRGKTYTVTKISSGAFCENLSVQAVYFPSQLTEIENNAFRDCENLWILGAFPETLTEIGDYAFKGLKNLQTLILPDSELKVGDYAFYGCENLTYIVVPEKVKSFGDYAFCECRSINSLYGLGTQAPDFEQLTFANTYGGQLNLYYPKGYDDAWAAYIYFRSFPRTNPVVCLDVIDAATFVGADAKLTAVAYGYLGATIETMEWSSSNTDVATED